mmetsp:Transcript_12749/g.18545  ORF Transcript_12749/g.18545 Transcript_12749/m.18545 type:complete len:247 (+) Transcript_12749:420-1160(+)
MGNETICTNRVYAKEEILAANDTGLSVWELWISSGILTALILKFAITNFGLALLKLADPFCTCGGKYESPPMVINSDNEQDVEDNQSLAVTEEVTKDKEAELYTIAIRQSIFWGFISNFCLVTLLVTAVPNFTTFTTPDIITFGVLVVVSITIPFSCSLFTKCMNRVVENEISAESASAGIGIMNNITGLYPDTTKSNTKTGILAAIKTPKKEMNAPGLLDTITNLARPITKAPPKKSSPLGNMIP